MQHILDVRGKTGLEHIGLISELRTDPTPHRLFPNSSLHVKKKFGLIIRYKEPTE